MRYKLKVAEQIPDQMTYFRWHRSKRGYHCTEVQYSVSENKGHKESWVCTFDNNRNKEEISPLEVPDLYQEFSELLPRRSRKDEVVIKEQAKSKIEQFANKYGLLTEGLTRFPINGKKLLAEPIDFWFEEIHTMQRAIDLFRSAQKDSKPEMLQTLINNYLGNRGEILALGTPWLNLMKGHGISAQVFWNDEDKNLQRYFVPNNLLSAMWLQLANMIEGNKEFRRCAVCDTAFVIKADFPFKKFHARDDRLFCNKRCTQQSIKKRKKRTQLLAKQGFSIEEISKDLKRSFGFETKSWQIERWASNK